MRDIRDILKNTEVVFEIAISVSIQKPSIMFLFRNNGEEVEIDTERYFVTHQLTPTEIEFIKEHYPSMNISDFKIKKKIYL